MRPTRPITWDELKVHGAFLLDILDSIMVEGVEDASGNLVFGWTDLSEIRDGRVFGDVDGVQTELVPTDKTKIIIR